MFRGYLHDDERYRKCFAGGWYLTGDLARRDADGYFWFVGRADDLIKSAGHLIGPFEVESALMEHPAVAEAGVIGKPDPVSGEVVKAFVTLKPARAERGAADGGTRLRPAAAGRGRRPKEIEFVEDLPKNRAGKIMRRLLKARELGLPEGDTSDAGAGLPNEQNDVYAMTHTSDGGFIATGLRLRPQGSLSTPATWVLKFDAAGNLQWDRTFTGGSARAIVEASDGTYVLSGGKAIPGSLESFVWAIKIDASGQKLWERAYHQRVFLLLESGLAEAPDGGYLISGRDFVQKVDADGFLVWSQPYRYLIFHSLAILQDGRIAAAGRDIATGSEHAFVAVLAPDGKPLWTNSELLAPSGFAKVLPLAYERTTGVAVAGWVPTCTDGLSFDLLLGTLWEY
jgi:hypothetical protein